MVHALVVERVGGKWIIGDFDVVYRHDISAVAKLPGRGRISRTAEQTLAA